MVQRRPELSEQLRTNNDGSNNSISSRRIANRCPGATASELLVKLIWFYQGRV